MKFTKILAAGTMAAVAVVGVAGSTPAQACSARSGYNVEGTQLVANNSTSTGPVYVDFRSRTNERGKLNAGLHPTHVVKNAGNPNAAIDVFNAAQSFWLYVESNGVAKLQNGNAANPAYVALENDDADCGKSTKPDTVLY